MSDVLTYLPIVASLVVFPMTMRATPLRAARIALGALALFEFLSFMAVTTIEATGPDRGFLFASALPRAVLLIGAWIAIARDAPSGKAVVLALAAVALVVVMMVLGGLTGAFIAANLAESGRRSDGFPMLALLSAAAVLALAIRAMVALNALSKLARATAGR